MPTPNDTTMNAAAPDARPPVAHRHVGADALPRWRDGAHALVLGLGASGLAMARWAARCGAAVTVWDSREQPPHADALAQALPAARRVHGAFDDVRAALDGVTHVLKSPGLSPLDARIAPLLAAAQARALVVRGELGLFAQALQALDASVGYRPKVVAITGTNGKTTTTSLTAQLVERCARRVAVAGNIGPTMLDTLAQALDVEAAQPRADAPDDAPPEVASPVPAHEDATAAAVTDAAVADAAPDGAVGASDGAEAAASEAAAEADVVAVKGDDDAGRAADADADADVTAAVADADADVDAPRPLPIAPPPPAPPTFAHLPEVWVLELSSFQLDGVEGFEPDAAAVLNVTQDHLDWHGTMAAYTAAKARIHGAADGWGTRLALDGAASVALPRTTMVVNTDDAAVEAMVPAAVTVKGGRGQKPRRLQPRVVRFGLDAPQHAGDFGLVEQGGIAWLVRAQPADDTPVMRADAGEAPALQRLMPADALRIRGRHNAANALAALALATAVGCPLAPMLHGLREYRGEPHRVQSLFVVDGIDFVDDSKGTNVGATVAALRGLGADKAPGRLAVILGGDGKGQDFAPLAAPLARHACSVALIGRDADAIAAAIGDACAHAGIEPTRHADLPAATRAAFAAARSGDAVLLSPACASMDMFRDYAHRAAVFAATAAEIAAERGAVAEGVAEVTA